MQRKMRWRALEAAAFCAVLLAVLTGLTALLERKESRNQFGPFLENPKQYDVLFFGDSCLVNCLYPMELWTDYGIPGYNLACYGNTLAVSYWSMMNALDYARPQTVVLAANDVRKDIKVTGSSGDLHTALDFWPLSLTKARAIEDLTSDPLAVDDDGNRYADMKWEYYFTLGKYHDRWSRLTPNDFADRRSVQKGADMMVHVADAKDYDIIDSDWYAEEQGAGYAYLRRAIEACQRRNIQVLLIYVPYPASEESQMNANTVESIAAEYGVEYINFIQMDSVVDYATDCYDQRAHLNPSGGLKVTDYIGRYLIDHGMASDRRGDPAYAGWAEDEQAYAAHKRSLMASQTTLENLLVFLHDDDVNASVAIRPGAAVYAQDKAYNLLHNAARERVHEENAYRMWSNSLFPLAGLDEAAWAGEAYFLELDRTAGTVRELTGSAASEQAQRALGSWQEGCEIWIQARDSKTGEVIVERQF